MLMQLAAAPYFRMTCSRNMKVRLCSVCCRTCNSQSTMTTQTDLVTNMTKDTVMQNRWHASYTKTRVVCWWATGVKRRLLWKRKRAADKCQLLYTAVTCAEEVVSYLHNCSPGVWVCGCFGAVWAHVCLHHILNHKGLLQYGTIENLTLDCQLCFQSTRVGLCPDETCIYQLDLHRKLTGEGDEVSVACCMPLAPHICRNKHDNAIRVRHSSVRSNTACHCHVYSMSARQLGRMNTLSVPSSNCTS